VESRVIRRSRRRKLLIDSVIRLGASVLVALVAIMAALVPATAWADGGIDPVNCDTNPTAPQCVVDVITIGNPGGSASGGVSQCHDFAGDVAPCFIQKWGWNGGDGCYYKPASQGWVDTFGAPTPPAAWYEGWCGSVASGLSMVTRMRIFGSPPGQALLVQEAIRRLQLPAPAIRVNPAPPAAQLVFLPTWLWVDRATWGSRSATASVPGLSVTATATPSTVVWSTGDGGRVTCHGAGSAWRTGADPKAASPDCGHTYTRPSGSGTFTVAATITWNVSWVGGGTSGTEPALTSTAGTQLTVAESRTVNTNAG
jgi:hypothetical protein